jgi:hypothetical protein
MILERTVRPLICFKYNNGHEDAGTDIYEKTPATCTTH